MAKSYTKPEVWWTDRLSIAIASQSGDTFSGPAGSKQVTLYVIKRCDLFTDDLTEDLADSGLLEEFHDAIVSKGIGRGYEMSNPQLAAFWEMKYHQKQLDGKRYANVGEDGSSYMVIGQDF